MPNELISTVTEEKAINILINKDDIFSISILNETYEIVADKCKGCTACARVCPVGAITGAVKELHVIDTKKCIKCGACIEKCKFNAIVKN